ncbi:hypothetical protein Tco_0040103 [Tanacetum coccineum]
MSKTCRGCKISRVTRDKFCKELRQGFFNGVSQVSNSKWVLESMDKTGIGGNNEGKPLKSILKKSKYMSLGSCEAAGVFADNAGNAPTGSRPYGAATHVILVV